MLRACSQDKGNTLPIGICILRAQALGHGEDKSWIANLRSCDKAAQSMSALPTARATIHEVRVGPGGKYLGVGDSADVRSWAQVKGFAHVGDSDAVRLAILRAPVENP